MIKLNLYAIGLAAALLAPAAASAATSQTIYKFPVGIAATSLALATDGTLYGAAYNLASSTAPYLFHLTPPAHGTGAWTASTIPYLSLCPGVSGAIGRVIVGNDGLYAFTGLYGGAPDSLIKLTPPAAGQTAWSCGVLQTFSGGPSGGDPFQVQLLGFGNDGGLYALALQDFGGDGYLEIIRFGGGAIGGWSYTIPYVYPFISVLGGLPSFDAAGNLVGAFYNSPNGPGVYRLTPPSGGSTSWTASTLFSFNTPTQQILQPLSTTGLSIDPAGNLYGDGIDRFHDVVYQLAPPVAPGGSWTYTPIFQSPKQPGKYQLTGSAVLSTGALAVPTETSMYGLTAPSGGTGLWTGTLTPIGLHKNVNQGGIGSLLAGPNGVAYGSTYGTQSIVFSYTP